MIKSSLKNFTDATVNPPANQAHTNFYSCFYLKHVKVVSPKKSTILSLLFTFVHNYLFRVLEETHSKRFLLITI